MLLGQNNQIQNMIAICNMDVEGLKIVLRNDDVFLEMKKNNFIDKMSELFDDFKSHGNSGINVNLGKCKSTICSNKGCSGFAFVADFTMEYFSFVIENKKDKLEGLTQCFDLLTKTITLDEEKNIMINFWYEEKYDFYAADEFLQTVFDVKQAKILLGDLSHLGITKSSLLMWLDRYEKLFTDSVFFYRHRCRYYKSFAEFGELFFSLVDLGIIVKNESKVISILEQMKYTKRKRHLQLYDENEDLLSTLNCVNIYRENGLINITSEGVVYHFDHQDFKKLYDFIELSTDLIYKYYRSK